MKNICKRLLNHNVFLWLSWKHRFLYKTHYSNVWQNPNDPDNENKHFKQPHIAIEKIKLVNLTVKFTVPRISFIFTKDVCSCYSILINYLCLTICTCNSVNLQKKHDKLQKISSKNNLKIFFLNLPEQICGFANIFLEIYTFSPRFFTENFTFFRR